MEAREQHASGCEDFESILRELMTVRADIVASTSSQSLSGVHANYRESAVNLLHYLALRRRDLRPIQLRLAACGLSSLGRAESHVLATINAVAKILHQLTGNDWEPPPDEEVLDSSEGQELLARHTNALFGPPASGRAVRIMVTMPKAAADDYNLVYSLLKHGMDCMRVNCARDNPAIWLRMIQNLRRAEQSLARSCKIVMDLAGPKLRTGPLEPGPAVALVCPQRDLCGKVIRPARIWLTPDSTPYPPPSLADACLPVAANWLRQVRAGEVVRFTDARGANRSFTILDVAEEGCWADAAAAAYIVPGTLLHRGADSDHGGPIGDLPRIENEISLHQGDSLILTRNLKPGRPATYDKSGRILTPAVIGCTLPEVFDDVAQGQSIWLDEGRIGGLIEKVDEKRAVVRITFAAVRGSKLRADRGINLPDSQLDLPALTADDIADLPFIAEHADILELSFANNSGDVEALQEILSRIARAPAIVLKIETRRGFENLPEMLLTAMRAPCCGVMIARGDLAVECGFERLAEVQEEILWICEAAHVPVIWATQVLETLAKKGRPSRAEITDAAMGHRAECVMLNKGPHVLNAVDALDDILRRMQAHQVKKSAMLRPLHLARLLSRKEELEHVH